MGRQREGIHPRRAADNNMAEELKVVLRKSENFTYGFSLLGTAGLPHVIYDILENSPAAECGEVRVQCNYIYMYMNCNLAHGTRHIYSHLCCGLIGFQPDFVGRLVCSALNEWPDRIGTPSIYTFTARLHLQHIIYGPSLLGYIVRSALGASGYLENDKKKR